MDVNGTRFHLLVGRADWLGPDGAAVPGELEWRGDTDTLGLKGEPFFYPPGDEKPPSPDDRRGAARDRYGNWYWIEADRTRISFAGDDTRGKETFWDGTGHPNCLDAPAEPPPGAFTPVAPPAEPTPWTLSTLVVTEDHYLLVAASAPRGLLVFDLRASGPPMRLVWPDDVPFVPTDMAPRPGGGAWILDAGRGVLWLLDRHLRVLAPHVAAPPDALVPTEFQPVSGDVLYRTSAPPSARIAADMAIPIDVTRPIAVEAMPDDSVLVLGADPAGPGPVVSRYRFAAQPPARGCEVPVPGGGMRAWMLLDRVPLASVPGAPPRLTESLPFGHDFAFVPASGGGDPRAGRLYVVTPDGNQALAFDVTAAGDDHVRLDFRRGFFPMHKFGGKALVASAGEIHYDSANGDRWLPLVEQPRPLFVRQARIVLPPNRALPFDGRDPGCVWHRLFLDACIPPDSDVLVESRAADRRADLEQQPWIKEPQPYLRADGAEVPLYRPPLAEAPGRAGTWETLFQAARGRFLQIRLTLSGTGRVSPSLHAMRVYYPRFSYLDHYLPAAYRENPTSAAFLDRFLANVEGFFTVLEGQIAGVQELFDTRTTPAELLDWLGGWFSLSLDAAWSESKRRLFLAHAPQVLRERGGRAGLVRALRLALESCAEDSLFDSCPEGSCSDKTPRFSVRVLERFVTRAAPGVVFGDPTDALGPGATSEALDWSPAQGSAMLHERYRAYLQARFADIDALNAQWGTSYAGFDDPTLVMPALAPTVAAAAETWRRFVREALGFTYLAPTAAELPLYRDFVARRHVQPADLNAAYGLTGSRAVDSFAKVAFPTELPSGGPALQDWILFVSVVLPTQRNAHRFIVLVPVALDDSREAQLAKLEIARRVAELAKPAHTSFDVRGYWAAFRVGEARVGIDTALAEGARFAALLLGRGELGGGTLAFTEPRNAPDRMVLGRDRMITRPRRSLPDTRAT